MALVKWASRVLKVDFCVLEEANVICRMAGYPKGAKEALIASHFGHGPGDLILDELDCRGTENSLLDCKFNPWTQHDCRNSEWAGVVCQLDQECNEDEWQCANGESCIDAHFLCDNQAHCPDNSDEAAEQCSSPIEVRLVDGNNATTGRLELKYKGVWGTICEDHFGPSEAQVACRMLGFEETNALIHPSLTFDSGSGPIWIDRIQCTGQERSLRDCTSSEWRPSYNCKHLEDVSIECIPKQEENEIFDNRIQPTERVECGVPMVEHTPNLPLERRRLAGGHRAPKGAQPWTASIRVQGSTQTFHLCGGVLLSRYHVLTAAHCMEGYPTSSYRVRVGDWNMEVEDFQEQTLEVDTVFFHEEYNVGVYLNNDIALLKLKDEVEFGTLVVPACLPHKNVVYDTHLNCTVSGWGHMSLKDPGYTTFLQSAQIPYLQTEQCLKPNVYGTRKLSSGMFCAGYLEGGVDTCQGDSGGGLICEVRGRQAILGLTSWGIGCGRPNKPGVYTKVADYFDWISEKIIL